MKKFLQYILAILLFSFLGVILTNKTSIEPVFRQALYKLNINRPCSQPIKYAIGNIDPGFNLSESDLEKTILEAEKIWEEPVGKNLFQYDPSSLFRINMVYDERQKRTQDSQKLQDNLDLLESTHQAVISQYNNVSSAYKKRLDNYNKAVDKYEASLTKYNDEVDSWNAKGGAPTDVFNELKKEKKNLQDTQAGLEKERTAINKLIGQSNDLAQKEQAIVKNYNNSLDTYKNKYGAASQFDKGIFDGTKIDIFQFNEKEDLRLTIAHEFGHALGIDHLQNPQSLMYYLMSDQNMDNPQLSSEDLSALKSVCMIQ